MVETSRPSDLGGHSSFLSSIPLESFIDIPVILLEVPKRLRDPEVRVEGLGFRVLEPLVGELAWMQKVYGA